MHHFRPTERDEAQMRRHLRGMIESRPAWSSRGYNQLCDALINGPAGRVVVYHIGPSLVGCDCASVAMEASDAGLVHLTQKRVSAEAFAYRAERRRGAL